MTHDYLRNGITALFAAFDVLEGTVLGRCMQRHRHQEFLRFLNTIEAAVPAGKVIHAILDTYGSHKHPKVLRWLVRQSLSFLVAMLIAGEAFAQATGDVSAPPKGPAGLEALGRRMAESPETRLDLYVTPQLTYEKFDDYTVFGKFANPLLGNAEVISPTFSIVTTTTSVGADYLFPTGLLLGGTLSYSYANYNFRSGSVTQFSTTEVGRPAALGEPLTAAMTSMVLRSRRAI